MGLISAVHLYEHYRFSEVMIKIYKVTLCFGGAQLQGVYIEMQKFGQACSIKWLPCLNICVDQGLDKGHGFRMRDWRPPPGGPNQHAVIRRRQEDTCNDQG